MGLALLGEQWLQLKQPLGPSSAGHLYALEARLATQRRTSEAHSFAMGQPIQKNPFENKRHHVHSLPSGIKPGRVEVRIKELE